MYCAQCGKEIDGDSRFCPFCGEPVESTLADGASAAVDDAQVSRDGAAEIAAAGETPAAAEPAVTEVAPTEAPIPVEAPPAGTPVAIPLESSADAAASSAPDAASAPSNLKAAAANSRRKSLRKMPLIVLVALAMLLVSSIAFAAYLVVQNVVIPAMEQQEQLAETSAKVGMTDTGNGQVAAGNVEITKATGQVESAFQLADILAMADGEIEEGVYDDERMSYPESAPGGFLYECVYHMLLHEISNSETYTYEMQDYLGTGHSLEVTLDDGEELVYAESVQQFMAVNGAENFYSAESDRSLQYDIVPSIALGSKLLFPMENNIALGWTGDDSVSVEPEFMSMDDLDAGAKATSIQFDNVPLVWLDESSQDEFFELAKFGQPLAHSTLTADFSSTANGDGASISTSQVYSGMVKVGDEDYVWWVFQTKSESSEEVTTSMGVCSLEDAQNAVVGNVQLYSSDEYDAADSNMKCLMLAHSILQDCCGGNSGFRQNILTGAVQEIWEEGYWNDSHEETAADGSTVYWSDIMGEENKFTAEQMGVGGTFELS